MCVYVGKGEVDSYMNQNQNIFYCIENAWVLCSTQRNINEQWHNSLA